MSSKRKTKPKRNTKKSPTRTPPPVGRITADSSLENSDADVCKDRLAEAVVQILKSKRWSTRQAEDGTGISASDFSRIRSKDLRRFTIERLLLIISRLGWKAELRLIVKRAFRQPSVLPPEEQHAKNQKLWERLRGPGKWTPN